MLLDFNKDLKSLDGIKGETPINLGQALANLLVNQPKGDAIKYWGWASKLYNKEAINVDESDYNTLKDFIKNNESAYIIFKAQLLEVLGSEFIKD
jgi:hypothetical protein